MYTASLVLGIISMLFCFVPVLGFVLSVVALIISIVATVKLKKANEKSGIVTAGLVLSIVATSFSFIVHIVYFMQFIYLFMSHSNMYY